MVMRGRSVSHRPQEQDTTHPTTASSEHLCHEISEVTTVLIKCLRLVDSPRLDGESSDHIKVLAESELRFPPIIVHRPTMRVVDGMHRVQASMLRGQTQIEACFFDGDEDEAFLLAVESNSEHGLPLSSADRTAAAARLTTAHPEWSDRAIASCTGLSAKTVRTVRLRSTGESHQLNKRIGRDGRSRPLGTDQGRRVAAELIANNPTASVREIARAAGISLGTAHNVRERLRRGEAPVSSVQRGGGQAQQQEQTEEPLRRPGAQPWLRVSDEYRAIMLEKLCRDPALRFTKVGRLLIRLFSGLSVDTRQWEWLVENLPQIGRAHV